MAGALAELRSLCGEPREPFARFDDLPLQPTDGPSDEFGRSNQRTVRVLTREQLNESECDYWVKQTSVGQFFGLGVVVAFLVGGIFVYQMMAGEIRSRMAAFATAKAMGYTNRFLDGVVLSKALLLALLGFFPGLALALVFYKLTHHVASIPIAMTLERAATVLGLTFLMCLCSGLLAVRKAHTADPAELF